MQAVDHHEHPVWAVYDALRTARLTRKYYCAKRDRLERVNLRTEVFLAATASGSALAGLTVWNTDVGRVVWQTLAVLAGLVAVAKPLLKYSERLQKLDEVIIEYRAIEHELLQLQIAIQNARAYPEAFQERFEMVTKRVATVSLKEPPEPVDAAVRRLCQDEVETELPHERFFVPPSGG